MTRENNLIIPFSRIEPIDPLYDFKIDLETRTSQELLPGDIQLISHSSPLVGQSTDRSLVRGSDSIRFGAIDLVATGSANFDLASEDSDDIKSRVLAGVHTSSTRELSDGTSVSSSQTLEILGTRAVDDSANGQLYITALQRKKVLKEASTDAGTTTSTQELVKSINIFDLTDLQQRLRWSIGRVAAFISDDIKF